MKKFENLGKSLNKEEQKKIFGGNPPGEGGTNGAYCNCYCGDGQTFSDPTQLDGCCNSNESCLTRCNAQTTCQTGSMYALCKGSCAA